MKISVKHYSGYVDVEVCGDNATIGLGMHNESQRDDLARTLLDAVYEIGPKNIGDCKEWFAEMLVKCDIDIAEQLAVVQPTE